MLDTSTSQMSKNGGSTDLVRNELGASEERAVYLALRAQFSGQYCQLRQLQKVRAHIQSFKDVMWVKLLLQKYGIDAVSKTAKRLLTQNVFDSKSKADIYFATRGEKGCSEVSGDPTRAKVKLHAGNAPHVKYISQAKQHKILRKTQEIAEGACFNYALIYMRDILSQKRWLCKEAVELSKWTCVLRGKQYLFNPATVEQLPREFDKILDSLTDLRHTAVHRLHIPLVRVLSFIVDAESISKLCEDDASFQKLNLLRQELERSHM
jgi:hypothetical protein